jgi:ribonuclease HI
MYVYCICGTVWYCHTVIGNYSGRKALPPSRARRYTSLYAVPGDEDFNIFDETSVQPSLPGEIRRHPTSGFLLCGPGRPAHLARMLLMRAGDVESNPGPQWPCGYCGKNVTKGYSLRCKTCLTWSHLKCTGLKVGELNALSPITLPNGERNRNWTCPKCCTNQLSPGAKPPAAQLTPHLTVTAPMGPVTTPCRKTRTRILQCPTLMPPTVHQNKTPVTHQPRPSNRPIPTPKGTTSHRKGREKRPKPLTIMQLNVDGVNTKLTELERWLSIHTPDVVCLQETKLKPNGKFAIRGYNCVRQDRTVGRRVDPKQASGGGTATLIREGLQYTQNTNKITAANDETTEFVSVSVFPNGASKPIKIHNLYVPPIRSSAADPRSQHFDPRAIPIDKTTFVLGDFNAHCASWDPFTEENSLGRDIDDWLTESDFITANSGEATRTGKNTGKSSVPDITAHHVSLVGRIAWEVADDLGSDHLPIVTSVNVGNRRPRKNAPARFSYAKAKWSDFTRHLEEKFADWDNNAPPSVTAANAQLVSGITEAANLFIPRGSRYQPKGFWNDELNQLVSERREARAHAHESETHRKEWVAKARETQERIRDSKTEHWQRFTESLDRRSDPRKIWKTLHAIDGKTTAPKADAALVVNGRTITDPTAKARAFAKQYASVSSLRLSKEDKELQFKANLTAKKGKASEGSQANPGITSSFSINELRNALNHLKSGKAPGLDAVSNDMLKHLGPLAQMALLKLFNMSWLTSIIPDAWKKGKIIPLPKQGKDPKDTQSYRPICLLSAISKTMEKMVRDRLVFFLENNHLLNCNQAGFRANRSTEDQVIRIAQAISDGYNQQKPSSRTVLTLVDFSRAFDRVWRGGLLVKLQRMGVPHTLTNWIRQFLNERYACVSYNGVTSGFLKFQQGLPQGSVLAPTLFLAYINDITDDMHRDTKISLFADDLALWSQHPKVESATSTQQASLNALETWAKKWHMTISLDKTESSLFTNDTHQAKLQPELFICGSKITHNPQPKFLGITFDRSLSFATQADLVKKKMQRRVRCIRALAGKNWGNSRETMRRLYITFIRSVAEYCAPAWYPAASATSQQKLEVAQNAAARAITGCTANTNIDSLLVEANIPPFRSRAEELTGASYEKSLRLPEDNPRHSTAVEQQRQRLKRENWRAKGREIADEAGLNDTQRSPIPACSLFPPWLTKSTVSFADRLPCGTTKSLHKTKQREEAVALLATLPKVDVEVWTDGSASGGTERGGAGALIKVFHIQPTTPALPSPAVRCNSDFTNRKRSLEQHLQQCGLTVRDVSGDGNCFYRALHDQIALNAPRDIPRHTHEELRKLAATKINNKGDELRAFGISPTALAKQVAKNSHWADNASIAAALECVSCNLVVHQEDGRVLELTTSGAIWTAHVGYIVNLHYTSTTRLSVKAPAIFRVMTTGPKLTSSYECELLAIDSALQRIAELQAEGQIPATASVRVLTDSQSAIKRLQSGPQCQTTATAQRIWLSLNESNSTFSFQWVPAHCDIEGNEEADKLAKEAARNRSEPNSGVSYAAAKATIARHSREKWQRRAKPSVPDAKFVPAELETGLSREERVALSQLRTGGKCLRLATYRAFLSRDHARPQSPDCPHCPGFPEDVQHLIHDCPSYTLMRYRYLTFDGPSKLSPLFDDPKGVLKFLRAVGFFTRADRI